MICLTFLVANETPGKREKRTWVQPKVKTLSEEDVDKHTIFDVIMPLPGKDVAYPGGALGERYREFLKVDGLNPDDLSSKHKCVFRVNQMSCNVLTQSTGFSQGL